MPAPHRTGIPQARHVTMGSPARHGLAIAETAKRVSLIYLGSGWCWLLHDVRTSGEYVPAGISILAVPVGTGIHQTPFRTYVPLSRSLQAAQRRPGGLGPRVVPDSQPAARTLSEWSRIEAVPVGTRTEVQLHDDEAPPDSRRVMVLPCS